MLGSVLVSLGLLLPPLQLAPGAALPTLSTVSLQQPLASASSSLVSKQALIFPESVDARLGDMMSFETGSLLLGEATLEGEKLFGDADLDGIAVAVIPFALVSILFVLFRVAKMFISAF